MRIPCRRIILFFFLLAMLSWFLNACAPHPTKRISKPAPPKKPTKPPAIDVMLRIKDWTIVQNKILNYSPGIGTIRFAGKYAFLNDLMFKFKSDKYSDYYWLAQIPKAKEGKYEIRAIVYSETDGPDIRPLENPPEKFALGLEIKNGRVIKHYIKDHNPKWGKFEVSKFDKKLSVLYFRNNFYPGTRWAARMPKKDGVWTIHFVIAK